MEQAADPHKQHHPRLRWGLRHTAADPETVLDWHIGISHFGMRFIMQCGNFSLAYHASD